MDILKEIEKQINSIKIEDNSIYLNQIFIHLDRAETYYKQGQNDQNYFNDVIYRSNQAYEGALKEAYKVLASKTDEELSKTTPHKIETHFKENLIFKDRVLQLFENYRQEWRNKSTHDYKIIFDANEAFIALINVSSFVHLLLKEIQESLAFKKEREKLQHEKVKLEELKNIVSNVSETLAEKTVKLLQEFTERSEFVNPKSLLFEVEILGKLHGFLSKSNEALITNREPKILIDNEIFRPDFILEYGQEKLILEIKRYIERPKLSGYIDQMTRYIIAAKVRAGILYLIKAGEGKLEINIEQQEFYDGGHKCELYIVTT